MRIEPVVYNAFHTPDDPGIVCEDESLTQQHFIDQCDINNIMGDYTYTGILPEKPGAIYGDFTDVKDYRATLERLMEVQENFLSMPPDIRAKFDNDPAKFIEICENPNNLPALKELGFTSEEYNQKTQAPPASLAAPTPPASPAAGA